MPFSLKNLRIERYQADINYNAAFTFWSLKGVLAERWGHGPLFGAWTDLPQQVTLTPPAAEPGRAPKQIQGYYGINQSGFNFEQVDDVPYARDQSLAWLTDVVDVLQPQRVTRVMVNWFAIYPISNAQRASKRLRDRFYVGSEVSKLTPQDRYPEFHSAIESFLVNGPEQLTVVVGVVGPPHKGAYLTGPDPVRDRRWWMAVRVTVIRLDEEGIDDPINRLRDMIATSKRDLDRVVTTALPSIVD
jgi:hypothetical protein